MHEAPPLGHSSPDLHDACLSPQFTEQPAQVPRGDEAGAAQELAPGAPSESALAGAAVLGGPASVEEPL